MNDITHSKQLNTFDIAAVVGEIHPNTSYGAGFMANQPNAMTELFADGESLFDEVPFVESALTEYRKRNELC